MYWPGVVAVGSAKTMIGLIEPVIVILLLVSAPENVKLPTDPAIFTSSVA